MLSKYSEHRRKVLIFKSDRRALENDTGQDSPSGSLFRIGLCCLFLGSGITGCNHLHSSRPTPAAKVIAGNYDKAFPMDPLPEIQDMETAMRVQSEFLFHLSKETTDYVGFKAALTTQKAQRQFSMTSPVRGRLLRSMLLEHDSTVSVASGARLMIEADLLVRVNSGLINSAESMTEAVNYIDAVIPFLEVPDLLYREGSVLSGPDLVAINTGARYGVMGTPVKIQESTLWISKLADIKVTLHDAFGQELAVGYGRDLMTHPLKALLWVRDSLKADGDRLRHGDLVSLGSMTRMIPAVPQTTITATYEKLDSSGPIDVTVHLVE